MDFENVVCPECGERFVPGEKALYRVLASGGKGFVNLNAA
jgi:hypothetical protein